MSYLALARKWRPRTFSQLIGQDHVNKALINALNQQRLHHAYLFTGTRGVGKTSVARILAKALNCEQGIRSNPCLSCDACCSIEQGRFIDLIEIDGASKTRVEDTRDLLDNVQYAPAQGRFKIYLIDEVHMLSQHSFNALLKTLEEPPEHVKFILATTDPQKLPVTVLSRCLQFNLKHLASELISQQLQEILKEEQLDFEVPAVDLLAHAARGSMRDALSLLDQAITGCDTLLNMPDVKMLLGYTQQDYALQLLQALTTQNPVTLVTISQQIAIEGGHFTYVLDELLHALHQIAVYQTIGDESPLISPSADLKNLAHQIQPEETQLFYQIGLKGREEIHLAPELIIGFTMTLLRMLTFRPAPKLPSPPLTSYPNTLLIQRASEIEAQKPVPLDEKHAESEQGLSIHEDIDHAKNNRTSPVMPTQQQNNKSWSSIIHDLKLSGLALNAAENTEFIAKADREVTLRVTKGHLSLFTPNVLSRIESALTQYYQHPVKLVLNSEEPVHASPAQQKEQMAQQEQKKAEHALLHDSMFQQLQHEFSAELVKNSIIPVTEK